MASPPGTRLRAPRHAPGDAKRCIFESFDKLVTEIGHWSRCKVGDRRVIRLLTIGEVASCTATARTMQSVKLGRSVLFGGSALAAASFALAADKQVALVGNVLLLLCFSCLLVVIRLGNAPSRAIGTDWTPARVLAPRLTSCSLTPG
jgi:hypothetical protein